VIDGVKRALVLAPHTDDGEFGCGGTMARLVEAGAEVRYVAFSIATRSLPDGFPPDTLAREVREATTELGIPAENLTVHDFDVRTFPAHRQAILELLIEIWNDWSPDCVFQPSLHDVHQDHQTIASEGLRATSATRRTSRSRTVTSNGRSRRSSTTHHSSIGATPTASTCGTSPARTASTSIASTPRSSRSTASSPDSSRAAQCRSGIDERHRPVRQAAGRPLQL
jgi:LmbE family N-acetylglucosaminyl deacetylase